MGAVTWLLDVPELQAVGWALVHSAWLGIVVGLVLWGLLRAARRAPVDVRYGLACVALAVLCAVPVLAARQVLGGWWEHEACWEMAESGALAGNMALRHHCAGHAIDITAAGFPVTPDRGDPYPGLGIRLFATGLSRPAAGLALVWLLGLGVLLVRTLLALRELRRLVSGAHRLDGDVADRARTVALRLGIRRPVAVARSTAVDVPAVLGWTRPVILLPPAVLADLEAGELEAVFAHELAHVRRNDFAVNFLQALVETAFFYNPAVWWISGRIRQEREFCCDDLAVRVVPSRGTEYLRALVALEHLRPAARQSHALALNGGSLLHRVRRLAEQPPGSHQPWRGRARAAALLAGVALLTLPLAQIDVPARISAWAVMERDLMARRAQQVNAAAGHAADDHAGHAARLGVAHGSTADPARYAGH